MKIKVYIWFETEKEEGGWDYRDTEKLLYFCSANSFVIDHDDVNC